MADSQGRINEIKADTFWGQFDDGSTFDMPIDVLDGHGVGATVLRVEHTEEKDIEVSNRSFVIIGDDYATVICTNDAEYGQEIVHLIRVNRDGTDTHATVS